MYELQTEVLINDDRYTITNRGDFRMVLDCLAALRDDELSEDYRVLASLLIFYNELDTFEDIQRNFYNIENLIFEMYKFLNCGTEESTNSHTASPVIDWEKDSQMICSAVNKVAGFEIRSAQYVHWWTFLGYYMAIGQSTLSTVVGIRDKIVKHKNLDKWEKEFKRDNPDYFIWKSQSVEEREAERLIREIWNSGDK